MKVQDIMTKDVSCCDPTSNAAEASEIMWTGDCGVLPVVEGGRVVGMITDRDLFIALGTTNRNAADLSVGEVMNKDLVSCEPADDVRTALKIMARRQIHRLPVVETDGALKGILSLADIVLRTDSFDLNVIKAIRAICNRQDQHKDSHLKAGKSKQAVA